ncbi:MAG: mechanosensitive ion channel family protein [Acidobacteriota bacterium]|nr:mechanosensitive ion channel family protein [Acidobacteriota bacterium]
MSHRHLRLFGLFPLWFLGIGFMCAPAWSQVPGKLKTPPPVAAQPETPKDALGRTTPRGTVLGFLSAARKGNDEIAAQYLDTRRRGKAAEKLAHELFVVLNTRLPARLNQISDSPEGSATDLLNPNQDLIGVVTGAQGKTDIIVERVDRKKEGKVWLFSRGTLTSIPPIYDEISAISVDRILPEWLVNTRLADIPLFEWIAVFAGMPLVYLLTGLLGRLLGRLANFVMRRLLGGPGLSRFEILPAPVRLILLGLVVRWMLAKVSLPLLARQFWATVATVIFIAATTWLLVLLTGWFEKLASRRMERRPLAGATSMLRLLRGVVNLLLVFAGFLVALHHFGVNLTAALAGLGVGGIAVALAAQKTLENVIGGASLIFDKAMKVGEFVKVGDTVGTVEEIGLRSTRIRTLDRSVLRIPNGQLASVNLESYSARDKFWLHPIIGLGYKTTSAQMHAVLDGIRKLLDRSPAVEAGPRVRLLKFGPYSLEVEVFAYVHASDWTEFLMIQEELLLGMMECVEAAGAQIALPSQTIFLASGSEAAVNGGKPKSEIPSPKWESVEERKTVKSA